MGYELGVDLGTTYTAAATHRGGATQIVELGNRSATIPSVIYLTEDDQILTGEAANRRAASNPGRVAREFKRRIGDPTPVILGGSPYSAESLSARLLEWVIAKVSEREGEAPARVAVTHPANWGPYKLDLLHQAVRMANLEQVHTLSEPEAAAIHYSTMERIDPGMTVAVFDLGGGTFDAAILRKKSHGFDMLGDPEGIERLGGIDFDAAVFAFVRKSLGDALDQLDPSDPSVVTSVARLRRDCVEAKEALSGDTEVSIPVVLPGLHTDIRLTRAEFEQMIRPSLADSISSLERAVRGASLEMSEIDLILLVGGSSRIPLVGQMVGGELGRPVAVDAHPKHSVAQGAAWAAANAGGAHLAQVTGVIALPDDVRATTAAPAPPTGGTVVAPVEEAPQPSPSAGVAAGAAAAGAAAAAAGAAAAAEEAQPAVADLPPPAAPPAQPTVVSPTAETTAAPSGMPAPTAETTAAPSGMPAPTAETTAAPAVGLDAPPPSLPAPAAPESAAPSASAPSMPAPSMPAPTAPGQPVADTPAPSAPGPEAGAAAAAAAGAAEVVRSQPFGGSGRPSATNPTTEEPAAPPTGDAPGVEGQGATAESAAAFTAGAASTSSSNIGLLVGIGAVVGIVVLGLLAMTQLGGDDPDAEVVAGEGEEGEATGTTAVDGSGDGTDGGIATTPSTAAPTTTTTEAPTTTTTEAPTTTTTEAPFTCAGLCTHINGVEVQPDGEFLVDWEPFNFGAEPSLTNFHAHFFFDIYRSTQVGSNYRGFGETAQGSWQLTAETPFSTAGTNVDLTNAPAGAERLCVTPADSGHGVINPENVECIDLQTGEIVDYE